MTDNHTAGHAYEGSDLEVLGQMRRYYDWIVRFFRPHLGGHVIEYGAGAGSISERLLPFADRLDLVEPAANLAELLRARFADEPRITVQHALLEQYVDGLPPASVDAQVLVNVLEHVRDDDHALAGLFRATAPGGHLLLFVPALRALMSELDRQHGHFRRYHRDELAAQVRRAGFEVVDARYVDMIGVVPWLVFNTWMGQTEFKPRMIRFYDRFVHPVTEMIESVLPTPFGKNVVVLARRP
ncbi:MAG: methyltransferase domain-containing protein [Actinomycetota bacterium]